MTSISMEIVRKREKDMRTTIRRSSAALVYSNENGIAIIAPYRGPRMQKSRVYRILDRIAFVPRGSIEGCARLAEHAIIDGERQSMGTSRGYVSAEQIVRNIGGVLSQAYHHYLSPPLSVEGVMLKVEAEADGDEIHYVDVQGEYQQMERAFFLGSWKKAGDAKEATAQLRELGEQLQQTWEPDAGFERILRIFQGLPALQSNPELQEAFQAPRVECVLLDRNAVRAKQWRSVFRRHA